jgi:hypothetical protein
VADRLDDAHLRRTPPLGPIVSECRFAVASFTKRPVIALREPDAFDDFELWLTVRGFLRSPRDVSAGSRSCRPWP